ncbi:MAG TPA: alpha/beta fold hydrolase [Ktedonobacteraceae bacterium]|nr:alpha/beta fold hydrolase [Ktedonobacteraceae bacterium]
MKKIGGRLTRGVGLLLFSVAAMVMAVLAVAVRHIMETPQPLESPLPGEARIYRWQRSHIFYKVLGPAAAPALVLLHAPGIGASSYEMRKIMEPLGAEFRVYAPDLPGFGLSDRLNRDYSAAMYIEMVQDFLRDVVEKPTTLVASGLSCNYAVAVAQRSPELCEGLVLISPTQLFSGSQQRPTLAQLPVLGTLLYPLTSIRPALRYTMKRQHAAGNDDVAREEIDYLYAASHQFGAEHAPLALLAGKLDVDVARACADLAQPTLLLWGTEALNRLRAIGGQHELVTPARSQLELIKDAGAAVHEEYPEIVITNILQWRKEQVQTPDDARSNAVVATATQEETDMEAEQAPEEGALVMIEPLLAEEEVESQPETTATIQEREEMQPAVAVEAYCVKCKKKTPMKEVEEVTTKNGAPAIRGKCSVCGSGQYRMGKLA